MDYTKIVEVYEQLEETQSTLEMTSVIAKFFSENEEQLEEVILLCMGRSFPYWKDLDLGISSKTVVDILQEVTGKTSSEIEDVWRDEGDLGTAAEKLMESGGGQQSLMSQELTVERVNEKLEKVARMGEGGGETGKVSMDKKKREVAVLLNDADPTEAKYIVRTFLENLRLGVGEGIIRDALAEAFFDGEHKEKIQKGYDLTNDFKEVARACKEGIEELDKLEIEIFRPINSMLAKKVDTIEEGFEEVGEPAAIDYKYDGMRAQIHKKGDEVKVFTRRLEDVTEQFPDVKNAVKENVETEKCIIDTEIVAYDPEDGSTIPFQKLSKRIKRKYDIQKLKKEIPVEVRPFDLIYEDGSKLDTLYQKRWARLEMIVNEENRKIRMADHSVTEDPEEVQELQQKSLAEGHEGIMMKSLDAEYKPGNRVGYMVKLKPVMETLDLAIIGAKWGEGRRSNWLSRLKLGCWDEKNQEYQMVGRMATGLTDEQLEEITEKLKPLIVEEDGRDVKVKSEVIIEAEYEEIQKSPNYSSSYALRFPRMKQFRDDKEEADSLEKVENLYDSQ
ncbi:MAG: DNA ligase-1 [Candidatus Nanohaloarchaea archaeon]|jgi:DNA ligase-1